MIVSPSMSLVAAGVASGICFILFSTLRRGRAADSKRKPSGIFVPDDSRCSCCLKPFLIDRGVQCSDCGARSCRKDCSRWDTPDNAWHCLFCHQRRSWLRRNEKWFDTFGGALEEEELHRYFNTAKSRVYVAGVENATASTSLEPGTGSEEEARAMETVRDFVEKIVEGLIGSVDDTPIDRLYDHPAYDKLLGEYSVLLAAALARLAVSLHLSLANKPSTDPPTMAHTALRELVERAVDEARKLPGLNGNGSSSASNPEGRSIAEQSYEDLLATAILNKVIEKFQREQVDGNSNVLLGKSQSRTKCALSESELGLDEGVEEGSSSLEPLSQDECSSESSASRPRHPRTHQEPLSLTIEERIEEVTTTYTSDEDRRDIENEVLGIRSARRVPFPELGMDIVDPSQESSDDSQDEPDTPKAHMDMVSPIETWEENWLFQKKRAQAQPDAVAMLVPNSSADFKALIGDKDAEDTSDLSECSSAQSDEEIEKELLEAINNVVPKSPNQFDSDEVSLASTKSEDPADDIQPNRMSKADQKIVDNGVLGNGVEVSKVPRLNGDIVNQKAEVASGDVTLSDRDGSAKRIKSEAKDIRKEQSARLIDSEKDVVAQKNVGNGIGKNVELFKSGSESQKSVENNLYDQIVQMEQVASPKVPKTPNPTPTRTSMTENGIAENEATCLEVEQVLNSLESAKIKLMDIDESNECAIENDDSSSMDIYERHNFPVEDEAQQESEYTEHYDIATQRHMDSLTKFESEMTNGETASDSEQSKFDSKCRKPVVFAKADSAAHHSLRKNGVDMDNQLATPPRPGTIAEREHKKWENAPPIENNPYSEESIQKRLFERQYSRRASDIPGVYTEVPKSNGTELEVVLEPNQPDMRRFGRDYYINDEFKVTGGDRTRRSTTSISSRPSSSLSQRSNSTSAEQDQQDDTRCYKDTEPVCSRSNDVKSKVANWQKNNAEVSNRTQQLIRNSPGSPEYLKRNDNHRAWDDRQRVEDILENERKNSKNEINAKLNNQDSASILETRKSFAEDNQRKIRRIDLKAYGFENEFPSNKTAGGKKSSQRVVNKLDLKSFGYDGGLRRTQSNNHIDSTVVNDTDFKPRIIRVTNKSNLSRYANDYGCREFVEAEGGGDRNLAKSTGHLNKIPGFNRRAFGTMSSATSVPNIAKAELEENSADERGDVPKECVERRESISATESKATIEKSVTTDSQSEDAVASVCEPVSTGTEPGKEVIVEPEKDKVLEEEAVEKIVEQLEIVERADRAERAEAEAAASVHRVETIAEEDNTREIGDEKVPLPSVRRLAEAFSKQPEATPVAAPRVPKANGKERSSTPEIHIVESPKQVHSLTARSLSRQFREALRQIPNKMNSPPVSHGTMEQPEERAVLEAQSETGQSNGDKVPDDIGVISPGKLKSNIMFWEQMQRRT